MKYRVDTKFNDFIIDQKTILEDDSIKTDQIVCQNIIRLQDEGVKEALVKLGWTPPSNKNDNNPEGKCSKD